MFYEIARTSLVGRNHRQTTRKGLGHNHAEAVCEGWKHQNIGSFERGKQLRLWDRSHDGKPRRSGLQESLGQSDATINLRVRGNPKAECAPRIEEIMCSLADNHA